MFKFFLQKILISYLFQFMIEQKKLKKTESVVSNLVASLNTTLKYSKD